MYHQQHALLRPEEHEQGEGKPYSPDPAALIWNSTAGERAGNYIYYI
jgi:hypothetical protein